MSVDVDGVDSTADVGNVLISVADNRIYAVGITSGAILRGPWLYSWAQPVDPPPVPLPPPPPDPTVTFTPALSIDLVEPPLDASGEFTTIYADIPGRTKLDWVDTFSDVGSGNIELLRKISDGAGNLIDNPAVALFNPNRCITAKVYGRPVITFMRGPLVDTWVAPGEESAETISLSGAPSTAYKLNDTILRPPNDLLQFPIQQNVNYDWTSVWAFSEHSSPGVKDLYRWFNLPYATRSAPLLNTKESFYFSPQGWPDPNAQWIWDRASGQPLGTCYFYSLLDPPEGHYQLWTAGLGPYEVWMNGVQVAQETGPFTGQAAKVDVYIQTGYTYTLASPSGTLLSIKAEATVPTGVGFMYCLFPLNDDGTLAYNSHARSDTNVRVLAYPKDPPGMTAGNIILSMLVGAIDTQGQFAHWDCTFNGATDSNGNPWPILRGRVYPTGTTVLEALRQLGDVDINWRAHPTSYTLDAFIKPGIYDQAGSFPISDEGALSGVTLSSSYTGGNVEHLALNWEQA